MEIFSSIEAWSALATLIFLEVILGIDNVIFISIVANKLPKATRKKARRVGLVLALLIRISMLCAITWIMEFNKPLFVFIETPFSLRDLILVSGGLFLIYKSTTEIRKTTDSDEQDKPDVDSRKYSVSRAVIQIIFIDFIFSFDSILTAVGLSDLVLVMIIAVLISIFLMMIFLESIGEFIKRNPSIEVLALGFLILIGFILILESFHYEIPKGYIYFAVSFSFSIEIVNIWKRRRKRIYQIQNSEWSHES